MASTSLLTPSSHLQNKPVLFPTPTTPASLSRKRKREDTKTFLGEPFTIEPHTSAVFDLPIKITPAVLLPRSVVPLSWSAASPSGTTSRLFAASIPALEIPDSVLIAKYDTDRQLCAVERVGKGLFSLYRLSTNVKLKDVRVFESKIKKSTPLLQQGELIPRCKGGLDVLSDGEAQWWCRMTLDDTILDSACTKRFETFPNAQVRLAGLLKASKIASLPSTETQKLLLPAAEVAQEQTPPAEQTPGDVVRHVKRQYFETLYIAKTSLAYFAKSTLSRARVQFPTDGSMQASRVDLVVALQEMVNAIERCDKKYKTCLHELAKSLGENLKEEEEELLSDGELVYAQRWMETIVGEDAPARSAEQTGILVRKKIAELRTRETELQIILLLEILAIKVKLTPEKLEELSSKLQAIEKARKKGKKGKGKVKKAKVAPMSDAALLLDLLVDRLCIWQSIGTETSPEEVAAGVEEDKTDHDHLQHFAVEVVMAFYSSRLPDVCASIKRKFAGKTAQPSLPQPLVKRETPVPREIAELPKKRALARSNTAPANMSKLSDIRPPSRDTSQSLSRAATPAEPLLPIATKKMVRGGLAASKNIDKRTIELCKQPRKKPIPEKSTQDKETELKDAIKNISKPNRSAVSEEMVSISARRMTGGGNLRKAKNPVRRPTTDVLVAATPRKMNKTSGYAMTKVVPQTIEEEVEPPSSCPVIPQSTTKKRNAEVDIYEDRQQFMTPTKIPRFAGFMGSRMGGAQLDSSPVAIPNSVGKSKGSITESFALLSKQRRATMSASGVAATPTKQSRLGLGLGGVTETPRSGSEAFWKSAGFASIGETPVKGKCEKGKLVDEEEGGVKLPLREVVENVAATPVRAVAVGSFSKTTTTKTKTKKTIVEMKVNGEDGGVDLFDQLGWNDFDV